MNRWRLTIQIYPHSTGKGDKEDREAAGAHDGELYFYVDAADVYIALAMAECVVQGIKTNPRVWRVNILGVHVIENGGVPVKLSTA